MTRVPYPPARSTDDLRHIKDYGESSANQAYVLSTTPGQRPVRLLTVLVAYSAGTTSGTEVEIWYMAAHGDEYSAPIHKETIGPDKTVVYSPPGTIAACGSCRFEVRCPAGGAGEIARATIITGEL